MRPKAHSPKWEYSGTGGRVQAGWYKNKVFGQCLSFDWRAQGKFITMITQLWPQVRCMVLYSLLVVCFGLGMLLKTIPVLKGLIASVFNRIAGLEMRSDDYWDTLFSSQMFQSIWQCALLDQNKKTKLGGKAYNSPVFSYDGTKCFHLLDLMTAHRPLVVNFGSCS